MLAWGTQGFSASPVFHRLFFRACLFQLSARSSFVVLCVFFCIKSTPARRRVVGEQKGWQCFCICMANCSDHPEPTMSQARKGLCLSLREQSEPFWCQRAKKLASCGELCDHDRMPNPARIRTMSWPMSAWCCSDASSWQPWWQSKRP